MQRACTCQQPLATGFDRRRFLVMAGAAGVAAVLRPGLTLAAEGDYDAMVLSCIDPRFVEPVHAWTAANGLAGKYSQFVIAGAAIGVVAPAFKDWHKAFWDNLATSVELHRIKKIIAIDHRDCGAAKIAYGEARVTKPDVETETHRAALAEFRRQVAARQPKLAVQTGLMALDGKFQPLG
ncbi:MAG TPA: carbonic anhydrase [Methylomirabilota bacterium]|nr:carbonic anhydrase [Methylomirabilota bacterium]